jgi:hypothetical protein
VIHKIVYSNRLKKENLLLIITHFCLESLRSGLASAASDVMVIVYSLLLQLFMAAMKNAVPPESIVRRVAVQGIGQVSGSRFSEFKDIIMSMVETYENEIFVYELAAKIHVHDLFLNHKKKFDLKVRWRYCCMRR